MKCEKWTDQHDTRETKKNLIPRQKSNLWPSEHRADALSSELRELMDSELDDSPCLVNDLDFSLPHARVMLTSSVFVVATQVWFQEIVTWSSFSKTC